MSRNCKGIVVHDSLTYLACGQPGVVRLGSRSSVLRAGTVVAHFVFPNGVDTNTTARLCAVTSIRYSHWNVCVYFMQVILSLVYSRIWTIVFMIQNAAQSLGDAFV